MPHTDLSKAQYEQMIRNLQRENALITTAWYDLTSRLQSNHVVLQRRNDVPRSWINKQRQMVNGKMKPCATSVPRSAISSNVRPVHVSDVLHGGKAT